jgi:hypothetical protein
MGNTDHTTTNHCMIVLEQQADLGAIGLVH